MCIALDDGNAIARGSATVNKADGPRHERPCEACLQALPDRKMFRTGPSERAIYPKGQPIDRSNRGSGGTPSTRPLAESAISCEQSNLRTESHPMNGPFWL
jgi:hypothetical protein